MWKTTKGSILVPSHKAALEPDIGKILGDPNMAFPFACCFEKLPVLANLRTAGFWWPESAEGFEALVQGAARLRVRLSARGARQGRRVRVFFAWAELLWVAYVASWILAWIWNFGAGNLDLESGVLDLVLGSKGLDLEFWIC